LSHTQLPAAPRSHHYRILPSSVHHGLSSVVIALLEEGSPTCMLASVVVVARVEAGGVAPEHLPPDISRIASCDTNCRPKTRIGKRWTQTRWGIQTSVCDAQLPQLFGILFSPFYKEITKEKSCMAMIHETRAIPRADPDPRDMLRSLHNAS
jgi:hypothetical protein